MFTPLRRRKRSAALTAIGLETDGVCLVQVVPDPGARPRVTLFDYRQWEHYDDKSKLLSRLAADHGLNRARCTTLLNEGEYALLLAEAPDVLPEELKSAIRWRIKDLIDFPVKDATLDVFELPGATGPAVARELYVVAARNELIQERVHLLDDAAIKLEVIDIPEMALRNLAALLPADERGVAFLSFGARSGLITLTRRGELYLSRSLDVGLDTLRYGGDPTGYFDRIVLEVQRSLDYYESRFRQSTLGDLVLAPAAAGVPGLQDYLSGNLNVTVSIMDLEQLLDFGTPVPPTLRDTCLVTLGAALRSEEPAA